MTVRISATSSVFVHLRGLWRHRTLIAEMTRRDVIGRYRGSVLGLAWSFFNPILMLLAYTFVFGVVFGGRWGTAPAGSTSEFALVLFVGLLVHGLLAECANRAPSLVVGNPTYVKKVVFPLETLALVTVFSAMFHFAIGLAVLLLAMVTTATPLYATALLLPIVVAPLILLALGITWFLASLGVYLRDVAQTVGLGTSLLLFLSPVFYPVTAVPARFQAIIELSPLTVPIEQARAVLLWGQSPDWLAWLAYTVCAAATAIVGFWWFQRTRRGFADVI